MMGLSILVLILRMYLYMVFAGWLPRNHQEQTFKHRDLGCGAFGCFNAGEDGRGAPGEVAYEHSHTSTGFYTTQCWLLPVRIHRSIVTCRKFSRQLLWEGGVTQI